jgi:hypothetical protein
MRRPTIVPRVPYEDVGAALSFLERAFGFREVLAARGVRADGGIDHTMVELGDGMIGLGAQGAHGAFRPKGPALRVSTSPCTSRTSTRTTSARSPRGQRL